MSFSVRWDNEQRTVIRSQVVGDFTWDDFVTQFMGAYAMMYTVDHPVDMIADGLDGWSLPPGDLMTRLRSVRGERPPNMRRLVWINVHPFVRAVTGVLSKVYPQDRDVIVDTLEEARALLASDRVRSH